MVLRPQIPPILLAQHEHPRHSQRRILDPACDGRQLLVVLHCRLHLPVPDPKAEVCVVVQGELRHDGLDRRGHELTPVQLHPLRCAGRWKRPFRAVHLPCPGLDQRQARLVG